HTDDEPSSSIHWQLVHRPCEQREPVRVMRRGIEAGEKQSPRGRIPEAAIWRERGGRGGVGGRAMNCPARRDCFAIPRSALTGLAEAQPPFSPAIDCRADLPSSPSPSPLASKAPCLPR